MPTYAYKCPCGKSRDIVKPLALLNQFEFCPCGNPMQRQISAPAVRSDYAGYSCPITGKWVEGRRAHEQNLKEHGCRVLEPGETDGVKRSTKAADAALDAAVEATAEEFVEKLSGDDRAALGVALETSDVQFARATPS